MAPRQALEVLERMLRQDAAQVAAVPVDWRQYRQFYSAGSESPLLSQLASEEADGPTADGPSGRKEESPFGCGTRCARWACYVPT